MPQSVMEDLRLFPRTHLLYDVLVFDRVEKRVYNKQTDMFLSLEETMQKLLEAVERFTILPAK